MLHSLSDIRRSVLEAKDGEIGRCHDFLFDDRHWTIRYMVADTHKWLPGRKVLVSPISVGSPDWQGARLPVQLTREQIKQGPDLAEDQPVSRQYESLYFDYYNWPYYWMGPYPWGTHPEPQLLYVDQQVRREREMELEHSDSHLRSAKEVEGYHIQATDGDIGHVEDFLADDRSWTIRYLVVDTRNWLPGRKVLIAADWFEEVRWADRTVTVGLRQGQVKESPVYHQGEPVDRGYERIVYNFYGLPPYWRPKMDNDAPTSS
ncbi:MAG: PRC-barrel domain-containing protein [Desulfobacterales bacterium]